MSWVCGEPRGPSQSRARNMEQSGGKDMRSCTHVWRPILPGQASFFLYHCKGRYFVLGKHRVGMGNNFTQPNYSVGEGVSWDCLIEAM